MKNLLANKRNEFFITTRLEKHVFSQKKPLRGSCYFTMLNGISMLIRILNNMEIQTKVEFKILDT